MPDLQEQFVVNVNFSNKRLADLDESMVLLIRDMSAIARGAVRPDEARQFALESLNGIKLIMPGM